MRRARVRARFAMSTSHFHIYLHFAHFPPHACSAYFSIQCSLLAYSVYMSIEQCMRSTCCPAIWSVISYISSRKTREDNGFLLETVSCLYVTNSIKIRQSPVRVQLSSFIFSPFFFFPSFSMPAHFQRYIVLNSLPGIRNTSNIEFCSIWKHYENYLDIKQQHEEKKEKICAVNCHKMQQHLVVYVLVVIAIVNSLYH